MPKKDSQELAKLEPARALTPRGEMERWFDDFFRTPFPLLRHGWWPRPSAEVISPSADVFEEGGDIVVKAELPGIRKDDVEVKVTDNLVTISGEKKREEKVENKDYTRIERSYGSFSRSFRLPAEVQTDLAKAKFNDGVLEVRVPKTEEARKREKKISID